MKTITKVLGNYWAVTIESGGKTTISTVELRGFGEEIISVKTYFNPFMPHELKGIERGKTVFNQYYRVHTIVLEVLLDNVLIIDDTGPCMKTSLRFKNLKIDFWHDGPFIWGDCLPKVQSKIKRISYKIYGYTRSRRQNTVNSDLDKKLKYELDELLCLIALNN